MLKPHLYPFLFLEYFSLHSPLQQALSPILIILEHLLQIEIVGKLHLFEFKRSSGGCSSRSEAGGSALAYFVLKFSFFKFSWKIFGLILWFFGVKFWNNIFLLETPDNLEISGLSIANHDFSFVSGFLSDFYSVLNSTAKMCRSSASIRFLNSSRPTPFC